MKENSRQRKGNRKESFEQKLEGEYRSMYQEMNTYLETVDTLFERQKQCREEILDLLFTAQQKQVSARQVIGNPVVFCGNLIRSQRSSRISQWLAMRGMMSGIIILVMGFMYYLLEKGEPEFAGISLFSTCGITCGIQLWDSIKARLSLRRMLKGRQPLRIRSWWEWILWGMIGIGMLGLQEILRKLFPKQSFCVETMAFFVVFFTLTLECLLLCLYELVQESYREGATEGDLRMRESLYHMYERKRKKMEDKGEDYFLDRFLEEQRQQAQVGKVSFLTGAGVSGLAAVWILVCIFLAGAVDWMSLLLLWWMLFQTWFCMKQRGLLEKLRRLCEELQQEKT